MSHPPQTPRLFELCSRDDYIHFVEVLYFGALVAGRAEQVLSYFAPGATLTGYAGEAPPRVMTREGTGPSSLDAFMQAATTFDLTYLDFAHVVDTQARAVASRFTLLIRPKPGGASAHMAPRRMRNCSFFQFGNAGLTEAVAWFANPGGEA